MAEQQLSERTRDLNAFKAIRSRMQGAESAVLNFHLRFSSEEVAVKAAKELREEFWIAEVATAPEGLSWSLIATVEMPFKRKRLLRARKRFSSLAQRHEGAYDGWAPNYNEEEE